MIWAGSNSDLSGVLWALRDWGEKWLELGDEHTNPALVLWAWCTVSLDHERLPGGHVVVRFDFTDQPPQARRRWMLMERGDAEVCTHHPGSDEELVVETDARTFAHWHLEHVEWGDGLRSGRIRVTGSRALARALPTWNGRGSSAHDQQGRHAGGGVSER